MDEVCGGLMQLLTVLLFGFSTGTLRNLNMYMFRFGKLLNHRLPFFLEKKLCKHARAHSGENYSSFSICILIISFLLITLGIQSLNISKQSSIVSSALFHSSFFKPFLSLV